MTNIAEERPQSDETLRARLYPVGRVPA
jgi:hypothetical protein